MQSERAPRVPNQVERVQIAAIDTGRGARSLTFEVRANHFGCILQLTTREMRYRAGQLVSLQQVLLLLHSWQQFVPITRSIYSRRRLPRR